MPGLRPPAWDCLAFRPCTWGPGLRRDRQPLSGFDLLLVADQADPISGQKDRHGFRIGHQLPIAQDGHHRGAGASPQVRFSQRLPHNRTIGGELQPRDLDVAGGINEGAQQPVFLFGTDRQLVLALAQSLGIVSYLVQRKAQMTTRPASDSSAGAGADK